MSGDNYPLLCDFLDYSEELNKLFIELEQYNLQIKLKNYPSFSNPIIQIKKTNEKSNPKISFVIFGIVNLNKKYIVGTEKCLDVT
jgi:exonuclease V gamma subunit